MPKVSISKVVNPVVIWLRVRDDEDSLQLPCGLSQSSQREISGPCLQTPTAPGLIDGGPAYTVQHLLRVLVPGQGSSVPRGLGGLWTRGEVLGLCWQHSGA